MDNILNEFNNSNEHIRNNFYFSFLALNFVNQKPFFADVILPVDLKNNIITSISLNSFGSNGVQEYGNSIRRHLLNDILIAYERYSMSMITFHNNGQKLVDPSTINDRNLGAPKFEELKDVYSPEEKIFLIQLRRLRNSIIHYNGKYNLSNSLDFTFGTQTYKSDGNEGKDISIDFNNILWIFDKIRKTVDVGNSKYRQFFMVNKN